MNLSHASAAGTVRTVAEESGGKVFFFFCLWTFVSLCRPQDIVPALAPLRPALSTAALALFSFLIGYKRKKQGFFETKQVRYYFYFVGMLIASVPLSLYRRLSYSLVFTEYLMVVIYFVLFVLIVDTVEKLYKILFLACLGSGLYSAFSITSGTFSSGRLAFGTMFDANDLAFFALCFLPLNLIFISKDHKLWVRLVCVCSFFSGVLLIFMSSSRGGMVALFLAFMVILFRDTASVKKRFKTFAIIGCVIMVSFSSINLDRVMTIFSLEQDYNVTGEEGRLALWGMGVKIMLKNPLTGVGVGCFANAIGNEREKKGAETRKWQAPHNSLVQIGTETGVIGLMLFLMMSWNAVKIFTRASREATSIKLRKIGEMGLSAFVGMFSAAFFLSQAYSLYWAFYVMFSAVVFLLLSKESEAKASDAKA